MPKINWYFDMLIEMFIVYMWMCDKYSENKINTSQITQVKIWN